MEKLRSTISQYGRWSPISQYIERIETFTDTDFSISIENAKSLLESIGKEICNAKGCQLVETSTVNGVLKSTFKAMGYTNTNMVRQISTSLATIGQQIGELRNEIGTSSHGKTLDQINKRNDAVDELTSSFLIDSIELVACFLIRVYEGENENLRVETQLKYDDCEDFNDYWDDLFGEFSMGDYSYTASEILFNNDIDVYSTEYKFYIENNIKEDES